MKNLLNNTTKKLIDFLFPPRCLGCRSFDTWLCPRCFDTLSFPTPKHCCSCGKPLSSNATNHIFCSHCFVKSPFPLYACGHHSDILRTLIHALKYDGIEEVLAPLSAYGACFLQKNIPLSPNTLFVPVPMHAIKEAERGFNQSEQLAKIIAGLLGFPQVQLLHKTHATQAQMSLDRQHREENICGAFERIPQQIAIANYDVILIDDVVTTGATLTACAKTLQPYVRSVRGVALAHGDF